MIDTTPTQTPKLVATNEPVKTNLRLDSAFPWLARIIVIQGSAAGEPKVLLGDEAAMSQYDSSRTAGLRAKPTEVIIKALEENGRYWPGHRRDFIPKGCADSIVGAATAYYSPASETLFIGTPKSEFPAVTERDIVTCLKDFSGGIVFAPSITKEENFTLDFGMSPMRLPGLPGSEIATPLESARTEYADSRGGSHSAINFRVSLDSEVMAAQLLVQLLGSEDARILMEDWSARANFHLNAPHDNRAILMRDSHGKYRNKDSAYNAQFQETSQEDDLQASGMKWAGDVEATIICATLLAKAKELGFDPSGSSESNAEALLQLSDGERELLSKLQEGQVRTRHGELFLYENRLRSFYKKCENRYPNVWALGA